MFIFLCHVRCRAQWVVTGRERRTSPATTYTATRHTSWDFVLSRSVCTPTQHWEQHHNATFTASDNICLRIIQTILHSLFSSYISQDVVLKQQYDITVRRIIAHWMQGLPDSPRHQYVTEMLWQIHQDFINAYFVTHQSLAMVSLSGVVGREREGTQMR